MGSRLRRRGIRPRPPLLILLQRPLPHRRRLARRKALPELSIDEYLALCVLPKTEVAETEEIPLKEISDAFRDYTERLESVEPPLEVADWHHAVLPYQKAFRESVDEYLEDPGDQSQDDFLLSTAFSLASRYQPTIDEAILDMDSDVQASMAMARLHR